MQILRTTPQRLWSILLLCSLCAAKDETARVRANYTSSLSAPTCPSTSINYITHTLPQICLRTGYKPPAVPTNNSAPSIIPTTPTSQSIPLTTTSSLNTTTIVITSTPFSQSTNNDTTSSSTVETVTSSTTPTVILDTTEAESENDPALDTAKFLSFEDWKNQNLAKAGQSAENVGARGNATPGKERKRPENSNGLETFGEDAEIDIDFGFGGAPSTVSGGQDAGGTTTAAASESKASAPTPRNKDAGKTCKERFNYASFDCAANILKTNARSKSPNSVLVENKDSYMLNECSIDNKFMIVELCDDILVDTIVLANFEFFSSMFRTFRISVSDRYPVKAEKWKDLGTFEARNSRDIQAFLIENPLIWARYLRVELLTHYGSEYYCPVSLLRIHGTTMMEEFRHQEQVSRGEVDDDDEDEEEVVEQPTTHAIVAAKVEPAPVIVEEKSMASSEVKQPSIVAESPIPTAKNINSTTPTTTAGRAISTSSMALNETEIELEAVTVTESATTTVYYRASRPTDTASITIPNTTPSVTSNAAMNITTSMTLTTSSINSTSCSSTISTQPASKAPQNTTSIPTSSSTNVPLSSFSSSTTSPAAPASSTPPATQESFFKSVHKRLTSLESNATLSLQYIESQSALLRDAFASASKRQLSRTTTFLDTLNTTISSELLRFKSEYEQLWQSTVLELSNQREEGRREREVLAEHVRLLAEEVVSQKRIVAVQAGLMLLCLGIIVFGQLGMGTIFASPSIYGKSRFPKSHVHSQTSSRQLGMSRSDSPADGGNDSAPDSATASAIASTAAGLPSRHWRQRWRWDSPFGSSVNSTIPEHYANGSSPKHWKPLPDQRRVRSEDDGRLLQERMQAMSMDEEDDEYEGVGMLSPTSPGTASVTSGLDGVSEGEGEGELHGGDHMNEGRGKSGDTMSPTDEDGGLTPIIESGERDGGERAQVLQVQSAPTTPMA